MNLFLFTTYDFLNKNINIKRIYEKNLITDIYDDKEANPIFANLKGLIIFIFQIVIIFYFIFLIHQLLLRTIFKYKFIFI